MLFRVVGPCVSHQMRTMQKRIPNHKRWSYLGFLRSQTNLFPNTVRKYRGKSISLAAVFSFVPEKSPALVKPGLWNRRCFLHRVLPSEESKEDMSRTNCPLCRAEFLYAVFCADIRIKNLHISSKTEHCAPRLSIVK